MSGSTPSQLYHVTLTTGHAVWSPRSDFATDFALDMSALAREVDRYGTAEFPSPTGLMRVRRIAPRQEPLPDAALWAVADLDGRVLATFGVAMTEQAGRELWSLLHAHCGRPPDMPLKTRATDAAPVPWLAVVLHITMIVPTPHPGVVWLGDFERCLAWGWIDGVYHARADR